MKYNPDVFFIERCIYVIAYSKYYDRELKMYVLNQGGPRMKFENPDHAHNCRQVSLRLGN